MKTKKKLLNYSGYIWKALFLLSSHLAGWEEGGEGDKEEEEKEEDKEEKEKREKEKKESKEEKLKKIQDPEQKRTAILLIFSFLLKTFLNQVLSNCLL